MHMLAMLTVLLAAPQDVPLFNGRDLAGWVNVNCGPDTFVVQDGEIRCSGVPTGVLRTDRPYRNFILELEWMHERPGGNAGLFLWSDPLPARGQPFTRSVEVQVMLTDDVKDAEGRLLYTGHGDIFSIHGASMTPDRPHPAGWERCLPAERLVRGAGSWNHYRVVARDGTLKLSVNGREVSGATAIVPREGYICLESEGSPIRFRNIRLTPLPDQDVPLEPSMRCLPDEGFRSLFDGSLAGWREAADRAGHWKPVDWRLTYDGKGSSLWTDESFGDFELICDWRWTGQPRRTRVPQVQPDGTVARNPDGSERTVEIQDHGDSGILLRGTDKSQANIWCWPVGSGEVYGYRTDPNQPATVRAAVTPKERADAAPGQWNRFRIRMVGDRLSVNLNGKQVLENAQLPGVPASGPIGLQDHGSPLEFANIYIRPLRSDGSPADQPR